MESSSHCVLDQLFNNCLSGNGNEDCRDSDSVTDSNRGHHFNPTFVNTDILPENWLPAPPTAPHENHKQPQLQAFQNISNPGNESKTINNVTPEIMLLDTEVESDGNSNSDLSNNSHNNSEEKNASSIAHALLPLLSDLCQLTKKVGLFGLKLMTMKVIDKETFDMIVVERDGHMRVYQLYNEALNSNANNNRGPGQMLEALLTSANENVFEFIRARVLDPTILTELRRIERKLAAEDGAGAAQRTNQSSALGVVSDDPNSDSDSNESDYDVRPPVDGLLPKAHRKRKVEFVERVARSFPNKKVHREGEESRGQGCQREEETKLVEGAWYPIREQIQFRRRLGPPCSSHKGPTFTACREFSEESRQRIFDAFWTGKNRKERREYVTSLIQLVPCKSRNISADGAEPRRRGYTQLLYALELNGQKRRVCLRMFISTLALRAATVRRWFHQQSSPMMASTRRPLSNCLVQLTPRGSDKETDNLLEIGDECTNHEQTMSDPNDLAKTSVSFTSRTTSVGNTEGHPQDLSDTLSVDRSRSAFLMHSSWIL